MRLLIALTAVLLLALPATAETAFFRMGMNLPADRIVSDLLPAISIPDDALEMSDLLADGDCSPACPCMSRAWKNYGEAFIRLYATNCEQVQVAPTASMRQSAIDAFPGQTIFEMLPE